MKNRLLALLLALLLITAPLYAGDVGGVTYGTTFQSAAAATGNGVAIDCGSQATLGIQVTITDTATVTVETSIDGTTFSATPVFNKATGALVTTVGAITATGEYIVPLSGVCAKVRARISAFTAGTVPVKGRLSGAPAAVVATGSGTATMDLVKVNGVTILTGNGVTGTGSIRVTVASDNSAYQIKALGNAGAIFDAPTGSAVSANAILAGGTDGTNMRAIPLPATGAAVPANALFVAGTDGTLARALLTTTTGALVLGTGSATIGNVGLNTGTNTIGNVNQTAERPGSRKSPMAPTPLWLRRAALLT